MTRSNVGHVVDVKLWECVQSNVWNVHFNAEYHGSYVAHNVWDAVDVNVRLARYRSVST